MQTPSGTPFIIHTPVTDEDIQAIKNFDVKKGEYLRVKKTTTEGGEETKTLTIKAKGWGGRLWMQMGGSSSSIEKVAKYINGLDADSLKQTMKDDPAFAKKLEELQEKFAKFSPVFRSNEQTQLASQKIKDLGIVETPSSNSPLPVQKATYPDAPAIMPKPPLQFDLEDLEKRLNKLEAQSQNMPNLRMRNMNDRFRDAGVEVDDELGDKFLEDVQQLLEELKKIQQSYKDIKIEPGPVITGIHPHEDIQRLADALEVVKGQKKEYDEKYKMK